MLTVTEYRALKFYSIQIGMILQKKVAKPFIQVLKPALKKLSQNNSVSLFLSFTLSVSISLSLSLPLFLSISLSFTVSHICLLFLPLVYSVWASFTISLIVPSPLSL